MRVNKRFNPEEPDFSKYVIYTGDLYKDAAKVAEERGVTLKSIEDLITEPGRCIVDFKVSRKNLFNRMCDAKKIDTDIDGYICIRPALERYCSAFGLSTRKYTVDLFSEEGAKLLDHVQAEPVILHASVDPVLDELRAIRKLLEEIRREHGVEY